MAPSICVGAHQCAAQSFSPHTCPARSHIGHTLSHFATHLPTGVPHRGRIRLPAAQEDRAGAHGAQLQAQRLAGGADGHTPVLQHERWQNDSGQDAFAHAGAGGRWQVHIQIISCVGEEGEGGWKRGPLFRVFTSFLLLTLTRRTRHTPAEYSLRCEVSLFVTFPLACSFVLPFWTSQACLMFSNIKKP